MWQSVVETVGGWGAKLQNVWLWRGELSQLRDSDHQTCTVGQRGKCDSKAMFLVSGGLILLAGHTGAYTSQGTSLTHTPSHQLHGNWTVGRQTQTSAGTRCADLLIWGSLRCFIARVCNEMTLKWCCNVGQCLMSPCLTISFRKEWPSIQHIMTECSLGVFLGDKTW